MEPLTAESGGLGDCVRPGSLKRGDLPMVDMITRVVARAAVEEHKAGRLATDDLRQLRVRSIGAAAAARVLAKPVKATVL